MKSSIASKNISALNQGLLVNTINYAINPELFYSHRIAQPNQDYLVLDHNLTITGWIVSKLPVKSINIYLKNQIISQAYLTIIRPGLNKKYAQLAQQQQTEFGFAQQIILPEINGFQELTLQVELANGTQHIIGKIQLHPINLENYIYPSQISPDFMVIGAMKSATSAIYDYLTRHSQIINRQPKEIHFFSKSHVYQQGWNWYLSHFTQKQNMMGDRNLLIGEASPSYISDFSAPQKIKAAFPQIKIIASLRNPTDRAISHYYHQINRVHDEERDLETAFSEVEIAKSIEAMNLVGNDEIALRRQDRWKTTRYLCNGLYAAQIKKWQQIFSPEQLLILDYHQLEAHPDIFLNKLFDFLDLQNELPHNVEKVYPNNYPPAPLEIVERLNNYFQASNHELQQIPGIDLSWC